MHRFITVAAIIIVAAIFVVGFFALATHTPREDRREVRRYGNLECVYNYDTDKVESCAEVHGG